MDEDTRNRKIADLFGEIYNNQLGYGLSDWFQKLQGMKLKDIKDEDISKLIRQGLIVKYAVFEAANRILDNPAMGLYDGEVLAEISKLSQNFWSFNDDLRMKFKTIILKIKDNSIMEKFDWMSESCGQEFWSNIEVLRNKLVEDDGNIMECD